MAKRIRKHGAAERAASVAITAPQHMANYYVVLGGSAAVGLTGTYANRKNADRDQIQIYYWAVGGAIPPVPNATVNGANGAWSANITLGVGSWLVKAVYTTAFSQIQVNVIPVG
jgi:hypothetical protein